MRRRLFSRLTGRGISGRSGADGGFPQLTGGSVSATTIIIRASVPFHIGDGFFTISKNGSAWFNSSSTTYTPTYVGSTLVISAISGIASPAYGDVFALTSALDSFSMTNSPFNPLPAVTGMSLTNLVLNDAIADFAAGTGVAEGEIDLTWTNSHPWLTAIYETDSGGTIIGDAIYAGTGSSFTASGFVGGSTHYFKARFIGGPFTSVVNANAAYAIPALTGNPVISAGGNSITLPFNTAVTHSTGSITFAGTSATIGAYTSGDGTPNIVYALTGPAVNGETITVTIAAAKFLNADLVGNALITAHAVTNNTSGGGGSALLWGEDHSALLWGEDHSPLLWGGG